MSDYHEIVDEMRTAMQSGELPWDGRLRELADGYAAACAEANERLAGLTRLLNQEGARPSGDPTGGDRAEPTRGMRHRARLPRAAGAMGCLSPSSDA